jgi:hypothetical protein
MMRRDAAIVNEMEFRMSSALRGLSPRLRSATMKRFLRMKRSPSCSLHPQ